LVHMPEGNRLSAIGTRRSAKTTEPAPVGGGSEVAEWRAPSNTTPSLPDKPTISSIMRIVSVEPAPVAIVFALAYAPFGFLSFVVYAFSNVRGFVLPIGIFVGIFHLSFNFNLPRSSDLLGNVFYCFAAILAYAASGWITGAAFACCFNFAARKIGGIDAKFVSVADDKSH
jgi:hypothetical protein